MQYAVGVAAGGYLLVRLSLPADGLPRRIAALRRRPAPTTPASRRGAPRERPGPGDGALALFGAVLLALFVCSRFGATTTTTARYLLPLYTLTPLVVHLLMPRGADGQGNRGLGWRAALLTGGLLLAALPLTLDTPQAHAPRRPITSLVRALEGHNVRVAYTDYWLAYGLTWESRGRVLGIPVDGRRLGRVRTPDDLDVAARVPAARLAWVVAAGGPDERRLRRLLRRARARARRTSWADLAIYDGLSRAVRPIGPYKFEQLPMFERAWPLR